MKMKTQSVALLSFVVAQIVASLGTCGKLAIMAVCVIAAAMASPAQAVLPVSDTFNDDINNSLLTGATSDSGHVWESPDKPSFGGLAPALVESDLLGQGGTIGVSYPTNDSGGVKANLVTIGGPPISTGQYVFSYDVHQTNGTGYPGAWLFSGNSKKVRGMWQDGNIHLEGEFTNSVTPAGFSTGNIHMEFLLDLDSEVGTFNWFDIDAPGDVSHQGLINLNWPGKPAFALDQVAISVSAAGAGVDNVCVADAADSCGGGVTPPPPPTDFEWTSADSGDWNDSINWSAGGPPGDQGAVQSSHHTVTFGDAIGSESRIVFTERSVTVNSISVNNTMGGSYTIAGRPSVNLNASTVGTAASLEVAAGAHEFQAPLGIHSDTTVNVAGGSTLTFNNALNLNGQTLTKSGDGTMTVNNVLNTGGGTLNANAGIVSGHGTIGGDVNNEGGTISPGDNSVLSSGDSISDVPEPSTMLLLVLGGLLLGFRAWRR